MVRKQAAEQMAAAGQSNLLCDLFDRHAFTRVYKPLLDRLGLTYPQYLACWCCGNGPTCP